MRGETVAVSDCFTLRHVEHDDAWWFHAQINLRDRVQVARLVAVDIVRRLLEPCPEALDKWKARRGGGPAHDAPTREELEAYLLADFADAGDSTRLQGAVVEHLWACLAPDLDGGWGTPLHVEHQHFSVIDHGGDGMTIYDFDGSGLGFRLWESKQHDLGFEVCHDSRDRSVRSAQVKRCGVLGAHVQAPTAQRRRADPAARGSDCQAMDNKRSSSRCRRIGWYRR